MSIFSTIAKSIFGDPHRRKIKMLYPIVDAINQLEPQFQALSDEQLRQKTEEFRGRIQKGETLDQILPDAFAAVREASKRTLNMRHFDVQLIGGMVLHRGDIAEMKTGEGKTLVATLAAYLNALEGKGVYVVTVNDYLAKRDSEWMGNIYKFLGLSVGLIQPNMAPQERLEAYRCDITYGTNNEFGFDYLRDNLAMDLSQVCQIRRHFAIVDEVDSILVDEARTPLIISGPVKDSTVKYAKVARVVRNLIKDTHFTADEKHKNIVLTEEGIEKLEKDTHTSNIFSVENMDVAHMAVQCLKALYLFKRDVDYVVKDGQVLIVDEFTGRILDGRRYSDGLHQAIEAIEKLNIKEESQTLASITFQNYFRMFAKLAGMTGTAETEANEFIKIYNLDVVVIPTNATLVRKDYADIVYKTKEEKYKAVVAQIKELHQKEQPVLVGTISIEVSEYLSGLLKRNGIPHSVLNAKYHEREAEIIAKAGQCKTVTIATNMAGRGTDIVLGEGVKELGGLFVIGTERHESRRIDNQLRGRCGRQGDPGASRFFVALQDDLMRMFGSERIMAIMDRLGVPDDTPIEHGLVSKSIERAQKKVEQYHFGVRKQILQYDDVMNRQRLTIYGIRYQILERRDLDKRIHEMLEKITPPEEVENKFNEYLARKNQYPEGLFEEMVTKRIYLMSLDRQWMDHLHNMDVLREGIGLRAYGQRDPLVEYKREGFEMFSELLTSVAEETLDMINKAVIVERKEPNATRI